MKTLFFKKGIILLATLFVAGITLSCHDADDEQEKQEEEFKKEIESQNQKQSAYQVGDFVEHIDDITALVFFNQILNEWYLQFHVPQTFDVVYQYYPSKLDEEFLQKGMKVVFSGDVYETNIQSAIYGVECYRVIITSIHEWTVDDLQGKVGYLSGYEFCELICSDPNAYFVQARATENPISQERVEEILTSLGAEITFSGSNYCLVNAEQRPVYPDIYVSPIYIPKDSRWGKSELWINPWIEICLNEGASWDEILNKYGAHLREKVIIGDYLRSFYCDLSTAEEVLQFAITIQLDPDVKWCKPVMKANITLDYGTKNNVLQIESEDYSETGLVYQSFGRKEKELRYERDGSSHMIYHLHFGCNIKESPVFDMLKIDIQDSTERDFNDLKVGDVFNSDEIYIYAYYTQTWMEAILKGTTALSGQVTLVDKKTVDEEKIITLRLNNLTFDAIDKTCIYTINGTIEYKV